MIKKLFSLKSTHLARRATATLEKELEVIITVSSIEEYSEGVINKAKT